MHRRDILDSVLFRVAALSSSTVLGFSGHRYLTEAQLDVVNEIVDAVNPSLRVVTGGCVGVDAAVAARAFRRGIHVSTIVPSIRDLVDPEWRSHCDEAHEMPMGTTYRDRNVQIVKQSTRLVGLPAHSENSRKSTRSGTWQTIRLGMGEGRDPIVVILDLWE